MSQNTASVVFTGTLLRREHAIGQKFVQLVFRTKDKNWLCISTNLAYTKLQSGKEYRIQGMSKLLADERECVYEPQIAPAVRHLRVKRFVLSTVIVLIVAGLTVFAVRSVHGSLTPTSAESKAGNHVSADQTTEETAEQTEAAQTTTEPTPTSTAPTTTATTKKKTTTKSSFTSTVTTPPTTTPAAQDTPTPPAESPTDTPGQGTPPAGEQPPEETPTPPSETPETPPATPTEETPPPEGP